MEDARVRVRIAAANRELEVEGDKQFVLEMLDRFRDTFGAAPESGVEKTPTPVGPLEKGISINEFVRKSKFKKHTDLVLAFGYFLERFMSAKEFTPADINNLYYEAKLETSNTSQMIILNIKRGFMMEAKATEVKGKRAYTLTQSGLQHVDEALEGEAE
jgi:hypothetical protein